VIEVRDLRFAWPGAAQDTLVIERFDVADGEAVFVQGESGCGKSTLLALLAGVLVPREGEVRLLGEPWSRWRGARRDAARADHVGVIFQQFNLLPYLSALANVLLPCRFSRRRAARAGDPGAAARTLLAHVAIGDDHWSRPAAELSVGQQQRVAAARALIGRPELVIADEPTSALDAARRDEFMALLLGECRANGASLVFVSHDERLAAHFDRHLRLPEINLAAPLDPVLPGDSSPRGGRSGLAPTGGRPG